MNDDLSQVAGEIARLTSQIRALRQDVDALRAEVRGNDQLLRAGLARSESRQNSDIADAKKKWRGWGRLRGVSQPG